MGNALRSRDDLINLANTHGVWRRFLSVSRGATTAATVNCGAISVKAFDRSLTVPSFSGGVTAAYATEVFLLAAGAAVVPTLGLDVTLGSLTVSGNSFSSGSAMPSRTIEGASTQLASIIPLLVITATLTATTPVITITYTDQDGNTGNTATLTIPTNAAAGSAFCIAPHLASGDTGIRAVTNLSISTGSAGTLKVSGIVPLAFGINSSSGAGYTLPMLAAPFPMLPLLAGDVLSAFILGSNSSLDLHAGVCLVGDD